MNPNVRAWWSHWPSFIRPSLRRRAPSIFWILEPRLTTCSFIMLRSVEPSSHLPSLEPTSSLHPSREPLNSQRLSKSHRVPAVSELEPPNSLCTSLKLTSSLHSTLYPPSSHRLSLGLPSLPTVQPGAGELPLSQPRVAEHLRPSRAPPIPTSKPGTAELPPSRL